MSAEGFPSTARPPHSARSAFRPDYEYGSVAFSRIEWGGGAFAFDIFPNIDAGDLITAAKVDGIPIPESSTSLPAPRGSR